MKRPRYSPIFLRELRLCSLTTFFAACLIPVRDFFAAESFSPACNLKVESSFG